MSDAPALPADAPPVLGLLEPWIGRQRWYAAKGRRPRLAVIAAWPFTAAEGTARGELLILGDRADEQRPTVYQVPVTYRVGPLEGADAALVGTLADPVSGTCWVYDAPHDPAFTELVLALVQGRRTRGGASTPGSHGIDDGELAGHRHPDWGDELTFVSSRVLAGEQSNTSVIIDAELADGLPRPAIVKVFRVLSPGDNPDVVLQSALRTAGCPQVPAVVGVLRAPWPATAQAFGGEVSRPASVDLAFAQEYLLGVEDAWRVALRAVAQGADFTEPARALGTATAHVHASLATVFGTRPATGDVRERTLAAMAHRYEAAVAAVPSLERFRDLVGGLLDAASRVSWPALQRIHGDYHLGQVLHSPERGWVLFDFEGEPLRPLGERSEPDEWLRDVAGMLRSIDYAGGSWERGRPGSARTWVSETQTAFLDGYTAIAGTDPREHPELLAAFELDKAMYETVYEARHRPDWLTIPVAAIHRLTAPTDPALRPKDHR